jgi:hypothetical protein
VDGGTAPADMTVGDEEGLKLESGFPEPVSPKFDGVEPVVFWFSTSAVSEIEGASPANLFCEISIMPRAALTVYCDRFEYNNRALLLANLCI